MQSCELLDPFCSRLFDSTILSHQFASHQFRNKIAYTLGPKFALSDLALPKLNEICQDMQDFREREVASLGVGFSPHCLNEVVVQMCRSQEVLVKLVMVHETKQERLLWEGDGEDWKANGSSENNAIDSLSTSSSMSVRHSLCQYLCSRHPEINAIAMQWSPGRAKSRKGERYETVFGKGYVIELTSTGAQYCLGPDTFSEIDHQIEDALFAQYVVWIRQHLPADCPSELIVIARDVNALTWGLMATDYFGAVHSITNCPCAVRDWHLTRDRSKYDASTSDCLLIDKQKIDWMDVLLRYPIVPDRKRALFVSSSRNGLGEEAIKRLKRVDGIDLIIYISCNQKTAADDYRFLFNNSDIDPIDDGANGGHLGNRFVIADFQSYTLAKTNYIFSATLILVEKQCPRPPTLVIPVGLPGSGKSSFCRFLANRLEVVGLGANVLERDAIFSSVREQAKSLKLTRQITHETILNSLNGSSGSSSSRRYSVVCLDSTNGNQQARDLYVSASRAHCVFVVVFSMRDPEVLLERCLKRENHPAFPSDLEEAKRKISNIAESFEWPLTKETHLAATGENFETLEPIILQYETQAESEWNGIVETIFVSTICSPDFTLRINKQTVT